MLSFLHVYIAWYQSEAWTKKKEKKIKETKKEVAKKKKGKKTPDICVSFIFLETNLCMPIRVERFDIVLHAFKCLFFEAAALSPGPPAKSEQKV